MGKKGNLKAQGYVIVYCATSLPTALEEGAYDGPLQCVFRNARFFDPNDVELRMRPNGAIVKEVYTNDPDIRYAYESLTGKPVTLDGKQYLLSVEVKPVLKPIASGLPTREELEAKKQTELAEEYGVEIYRDGRRRKTSDMVDEILGEGAHA